MNNEFTTMMLGLVVACVAGGCSQLSRPEQAAQAEKADADTFLHDQLESEPVVTVGEAYRAMLMLADGEDKFTTFEQREAELVRRGIVRTAWKLEADRAIDHGTVAFMILRILNVKGGVNLQIIGGAGIGDRRYAMRELVYMGMSTAEPAHHFISGGELVDLIARADDYLARHGGYQLQTVDIEQEVERQKRSAASSPAR